MATPDNNQVQGADYGAMEALSKDIDAKLSVMSDKLDALDKQRARLPECWRGYAARAYYNLLDATVARLRSNVESLQERSKDVEVAANTHAEADREANRVADSVETAQWAELA